MRTIKFRGKKLCQDEWIYGSLITRGEQGADGNFIDTGRGECYPLQQDTIGQFTGMTDKDGKEIYEGDILDLFIPENNVGKPEHRLRKVIFDEKSCGFSIVDKHNLCICDAVTTSIELIYTVIGNVHDNPELMEDK